MLTRSRSPKTMFIHKNQSQQYNHKYHVVHYRRQYSARHLDEHKKKTKTKNRVEHRSLIRANNRQKHRNSKVRVRTRSLLMYVWQSSSLAVWTHLPKDRALRDESQQMILPLHTNVYSKYTFISSMCVHNFVWVPGQPLWRAHSFVWLLYIYERWNSDHTFYLR